MILLLREPSSLHLQPLVPSWPPTFPEPYPPLPLRPCDSDGAHTISLISPSPQVQCKAGVWERKFQHGDSLSLSCLSLPPILCPNSVILMNEEKNRPEG